MGYINHNAIVVTSWKSGPLAEAHGQARRLFGALVSDIIDGTTNGYASFFVAPDGSKEGWTESDKWDEARAEFKDLLRAKYDDCEWAEISYGRDADSARVSDSAWAES
jgi:hypothetical protein